MRDGLRKGEGTYSTYGNDNDNYATTMAMARSHLDIFRKTDYFLVTSLGLLIDSSLHGTLTPVGHCRSLDSRKNIYIYILACTQLVAVTTKTRAMHGQLVW